MYGNKILHQEQPDGQFLNLFVANYHGITRVNGKQHSYWGVEKGEHLACKTRRAEIISLQMSLTKPGSVQEEVMLGPDHKIPCSAVLELLCALLPSFFIF